MSEPGPPPGAPLPAVPSTMTWRSVSWPEIGPGADLVSLVCAIADLRDGEIVLVTSKAVSKAEGRLVLADRESVIAGQSCRVVARRGPSVVAQTQHGLVMAAAGVDSSNTPKGTSLTLPVDPDRSARALREGVRAASGCNVAVVITDTAGRAWRLGQTDLAIGCAGVVPLVDLSGSQDTHGNTLLVTAPAVADELAAAADLVKGKTSGRPVAVVSGLASLVLPPDQHGPGAGALVRSAADDLFAMGTREAVVAAALRTDPVALRHFPAWSLADADPFEGLLEGGLAWPAGIAPKVSAGLTRNACPGGTAPPTWTLRVDVPEECDPEVLVAVGRLLERAEVLASAARLRAHQHDGVPASSGSRPIARICWQDR